MEESHRISKSARAFRNNFWNQKRIEVGLRLRDVAEATGIKHNTLGNYFTGYSMPNDDAIKAICDLFDVDEVRGKSEFTRMHNSWDAQHKRTLALSARKDKPKKNNEISVTNTAADKVDDTYKIAEINITLGNAIYGKVDYDTFLKVLDAAYKSDKSTIGEALYGVLDYDTWLTVTNLLSRV